MPKAPNRFPKPYITPESRVEKQQITEVRRHLKKKGLVLGEGFKDRIPILVWKGKDQFEMGAVFWDSRFRSWRTCFYGPAIHCWADLDTALREYKRTGRIVKVAEAAWAKYKNSRSGKNFQAYRGLLWEFFAHVAGGKPLPSDPPRCPPTTAAPGTARSRTDATEDDQRTTELPRPEGPSAHR